MIRALVTNFIKKYKELDAELKRKKFAITIGDELPAGIIQMAKVYIANKRKIGVGDKMAGRHGNKGIVSRVVRQEDIDVYKRQGFQGYQYHGVLQAIQRQNPRQSRKDSSCDYHLLRRQVCRFCNQDSSRGYPVVGSDEAQEWFC